MAERRSIDPERPGIVEMELDEGLEDTTCMACAMAGIRRRTRSCPHTAAARAAATLDATTQQVAAIVGRTPLSTLLAAWRRALGLRPWWATAAGRARVRAEWEREDQERERERRRGS